MPNVWPDRSGFGAVVAGYNAFGNTVGAMEALAFGVVLAALAVVAVAFARWLILPLDAFGGWYHERTKHDRG
ncbi:hypothetical protein [Halosolutus gelatinilyticus]|uniref:hypothetical protein n=1 Tax=Halosolutus gelatinilyticus TaxID=2931975 RepID=UPI001FF43664|nr:hypothetical protein [Halosolutus gelatinilyticus]